MMILIVAEIILLVHILVLLGISLFKDRSRRVTGRLNLMAITVLNIGLVLARGDVMGVNLDTIWATSLGTFGVCAFVAGVTWEMSDAKVYDYWLSNFVRQAVQSLAIPFFAFAWIAYHLIYIPIQTGETQYATASILIASGVVLPVSVAYTVLWQLLPSWLSHLSAVTTFTSALATVLVVNAHTPVGLVVSLIGSLVMATTMTHMLATQGVDGWISQPPTPRGGSTFSVAVFSTLLTCLPVVTLYTQAGTPSWVTVSVLAIAIAGVATLLIDALRSVHREQAAFTRMEEELQQIEYVDPITRVANRMGFQDALLAALAEAGDTAIAVYHLDLGGFRSVNDSIGQFMGDEVLAIVADRLANQIRKEDTLGRLGGDEFGVLLKNCPDGPTALTLGENLHNAVIQPIELGIGWRVNLDASIGVVLANSQDSMTDVMRFADAALHRAKREGNRHIAMLGVEDLRASVSAFANDQRLRTAFLQEQFTLAVQPVIDVRNGHTVGFEALTRWPNATLGPAEFIPLIEENGLADAFGKWVLHTATKWAAQQGCEIAVNVSPRHMHSPNFVADVLGALEASGLPGELLLIEITERSAMPDMNRTNAMLNTLRAHGIRIAVDDFGTGEFSLQQLMEYPLDVLKLDRSFVAGIGENQADRTLVNALIHAANGLGFTTIAEGVEDQVVAQTLNDLGCDQAQGYLWSAPMPLEKGAAWWAQHKAA